MHKHLTQNELYCIWQHRINQFGDNLTPCDFVQTIATRLHKHISTIYRAVKYIKTTNWRPDNKNNNKIRARKNIALQCLIIK